MSPQFLTSRFVREALALWRQAKIELTTLEARVTTVMTFGSRISITRAKAAFRECQKALCVAGRHPTMAYIENVVAEGETIGKLTEKAEALAAKAGIEC
jgi:hypothetical protein